MHEEAVLYIFFGGITFFLNIGLFIFFNKFVDTLISNAISWFLCVLFQFFTNKFYVFKKKALTVLDFIRQIISFFAGRIFTLLVEEVILAIFVTWLGFNSVVVKLMDTVIVIILNYVISKRLVFAERS